MLSGGNERRVHMRCSCPLSVRVKSGLSTMSQPAAGPSKIWIGVDQVLPRIGRVHEIHTACFIQTVPKKPEIHSYPVSAMMLGALAASCSSTKEYGLTHSKGLEIEAVLNCKPHTRVFPGEVKSIAGASRNQCRHIASGRRDDFLGRNSSSRHPN